MGRFNIDDILRQLGAPNPNAPVERVPERVPEPAAAASTSPAVPADLPAAGAAQKPAPTVPSVTLATPAPSGSTTTTSALRVAPSMQWPKEAATEAAAEAAAAAPVPAPAPAPVARASSAPTPAAAPVANIDDDGGLSDLYVPDASEDSPATTLEGLLAERGIATAEQLLAAERLRKQAPGRNLVEILKEQGVDERAAQSVVAELARMTFESIDPKAPNCFDRALVSSLSAEFCRTHHVLPLRREGGRVVVATASPEDVFLLDEVKRRLGVPAVRHVLSTAGDIAGALQQANEAAERSKSDDFDLESILAGVGDEDEVEVEKEDVNERDFEAEAESSPVVKYVNHIIQVALKEGASDIHIEPDEKVLKVRMRIDGVLFEMLTPPRKMHAALTSRIKIMSNLDIAERRLPQDGRIRATVLGRKLDLRVSTVPTPKGEKTVMRILDSRSISVSLDDLGFSEDALTIWKKQIEQPHGIILVTGPTGSGKTTTLYSSIRQMDTRRMNISTVEDPIEYNLQGITQIQTHEKIGMTFAKALKALLRQDPDVVMLGEIRDLETASTAIQAALTGHLVLSTLHTNDAPSSITRMINIGVEPFLVGAALNAVLAQRLVRKICPKCVEERPIEDDIADFLLTHGIAGPTIRVGRGCGACRQTGYSGRLGLYELLVLDDFLRDKIAANPNVVEFRRLCVERGMTTLREDGFAKVRAGRTTVEEVLSVTEATI
ncbi:MAG: GspE/PulE family protein [Planctomycetaceae bacterium]|nr:GspE/PulE family protein [Planctomycetaceae bacterium]